jgi:hypothetical protein
VFINLSKKVYCISDGCFTFQEDSIISRARGELNALVERVHRTEAERNRARIAEVLSFVSHHSDDIDAYEDTARDTQS